MHWGLFSFVIFHVYFMDFVLQEPLKVYLASLCVLLLDCRFPCLL